VADPVPMAVIVMVDPFADAVTTPLVFN